MSTRSVSCLLTVSLGLCALAPACSSPNNSGDAAMDASPSDSGGGDSAAGDGSDGAAACTHHLASGFTQVVSSAAVPNVLTGASTGRTLSMAFDENDDPMFAYVEGTSDPNVSTVKYVRWDPCAGAFGAPVLVDTVHDYSGTLDLSIAYDSSTQEVGIAYTKGATDNNWADSYAVIMLATRRAPAQSFSLELLSQTHTCCTGAGGWDAWSANYPSIAMHNGQIYLAYASAVGGANDLPLVYFLTSASTFMAAPFPPAAMGDGGQSTEGVTDAAEPDSSATTAGMPAHDFSYVTIPFNGMPPTGNTVYGWAQPHAAPASISVALDGAGNPGVAVFEEAGNSYANFRALFWRPGWPNAVVAYDFGVDSDIDLSLAFDGTNPRIAGHMDSTMGSDALTFLASADGMTWMPPVHPAAGGTAFDSSLADDGMGHVAIGADRNGSNPTCAANPYLSLSADNGTTWNAMCPDTMDAYGFGGYSINALYGASRIRGTLALGFVNDNSTNMMPPGLAGIVYWQSP